MIVSEKFNGIDFDTGYLLRLREIATKAKTARPSLGKASGNISIPKKGRGSILYDVRPWTEDDDIRHIDCYITARTGVPHVRTSHEERENKILFIADFRPSMYFGTRRALRSVAAAEAISIAGWRATNLQAQVGLAIATSMGTTFYGWARDSYKFAALLDKLASVHHEAQNFDKSREPEMAEVLEIVEKASGTSSIVIATALDTPGDNFDKTARSLVKRHNLTFLLITDKIERAPIPGDYPYATREGHKGILRINRNLRHGPNGGLSLRLTHYGARSIVVDSDLHPEEIARVLVRIYDGSR